MNQDLRRAQADLERMAERHGLTLSYAESIGFTLRVDPEHKQRVAAAAQAEFARYADLFGLTAEDYGKTFRVRTKLFTVVGIHPERPKNALTIRDQRGKEYRCSPSYYLAATGLRRAGVIA